MKRALLNVVGIQKNSDLNDKIELTTVGKIDSDENNFYIYYDEEQDDNSTINVEITISKNLSTVTSKRKGSVTSIITVEKGKRNHCHYATPYGEILMGIKGKSIVAFNTDANHGTFDFIYDIDANGEIVSENEVKIKYRITQPD